MALTGDFAKLRSLQHGFQSLASGAERDRLARGIKSSVIGQLKEEFSKGISPDGTAWQQTKRGRPALISRKLPGAFVGQVNSGNVFFRADSTRSLLVAHQFGATFKARAVGAGKQFLTFDKLGRLVKAKRALNKKGDARRGYRQTFARTHNIGARVLPARPIYPEGAMPTPWSDRIQSGVISELMAWNDRMDK